MSRELREHVVWMLAILGSAVMGVFLSAESNAAGALALLIFSTSYSIW